MAKSAALLRGRSSAASGAAAAAAPARSKRRAKEPGLSPAAIWVLRFVGGIVILSYIKLLSVVAHAVLCVRRLLRLPDPGVPRPAAFVFDGGAAAAGPAWGAEGDVEAPASDSGSTGSSSGGGSRGGGLDSASSAGSASGGAAVVVEVRATAAALSIDAAAVAAGDGSGGTEGLAARAVRAARRLFGLAAAPPPPTATTGHFISKAADAATAVFDLTASAAKPPPSLPPPAPPAPRAVAVVHIPVDAARGAASEAWRRVGPYLRRHGGSAVAASTLWNPEFTHCFAPGVGSLPYVVARGFGRAVAVAVGDPLAPRGAWRGLAAAFLQAFPNGRFAYASEAFAALLRAEFGLSVSDLGAETTIDAWRFSYGKRTRTIRNAARDARAAGVRVREVTPAGLTPALRRQLADVSGEWLAGKAVSERELRVLIRHCDPRGALRLEEGTRLLVAEASAGGVGGAGNSSGASSGDGGCAEGPRVEGFVLLDPLWRGGAAVGYAASLSRLRRGAHPGCLKLLYDEALALLRAAEGGGGGGAKGGGGGKTKCKSGADGGAGGEGEAAPRLLAFGVAPFFALRTAPFRGAWWLELAGRFLFHCGNALYQFQNLAFAKARYGGGLADSSGSSSSSSSGGNSGGGGGGGGSGGGRSTGGAAFAAPDRYHDDAVSLTHVYLAGRAGALPGLALLDCYVFLAHVGFVGRVGDTLLKLLGLRRSIAPCGGGGGGGSGGNGDADDGGTAAPAAAATQQPGSTSGGERGGGKRGGGARAASHRPPAGDEAV